MYGATCYPRVPGQGVSMIEFIKTFLLPGSKWFVLLGLTIGAGMLYGPAAVRRWGRLWLTLLALGYWLLTLPFIADRLAAPFSGTEWTDANGYRRLRNLRDCRSRIGRRKLYLVPTDRRITVPIEQTALNILEAAAVYRLKPVPVVALGGIPDPQSNAEPESDIIRRLLLDSGVPAEHIITDAESKTTREQAINVGRMLKMYRLAAFRSRDVAGAHG